MRKRRHASASLTVDPSANGRIDASRPPELPNLHNPTTAFTRIPSSFE